MSGVARTLCLHPRNIWINSNFATFRCLLMGIDPESQIWAALNKAFKPQTLPIEKKNKTSTMKLQPLIKKKWKQQIYGVVPFTDLISPFFHWQGRAESLNWLSSSLKAVRIKAHSRATTARSSAAVLHARMLRINSRSLIDMAVTAVQRWTARGERLLFFCPQKKKTHQGLKNSKVVVSLFFCWNTFYVMSCFCFCFFCFLWWWCIL